MFLFTASIICQLTAQNVSLKNGIAFIDGEKTFLYERNVRETFFYDLKNEEIVLHILDFDHRGTDRLNFLIQDIKVETSLFCSNAHRGILRELVQRGIVERNGDINEKALVTFYKLYNEDCLATNRRGGDD